MPKLPLPARALTAAILSSSLCFVAQADTLVDIYELALENDAQLKTQIAQYNADIELEKLALAPLLPQARAGYSFTDSENDSTRPNVVFNDDPFNPGFRHRLMSRRSPKPRPMAMTSVCRRLCLTCPPGLDGALVRSRLNKLRPICLRRNRI